MDDFLHNLRSGKLKQHDRSNRSYNDPQHKGGSRRGAMDRRKKELESFERLNAIKEVLEGISETQKRMAQAYEARTKAEERKAHAMEVLAKNIYRMVNPDAEDVDALFDVEPPVAPVAAPDDALEHVEPEADAGPANDAPATGKLSKEDRSILCDLIGRMRDDGNNWEKIAREIASQGYPTVSGKGTWRGVMAKNLFEKQTAE